MDPLDKYLATGATHSPGEILYTEVFDMETGVFQTSNGLHLYECSWFPEEEAKAVVVLVHGGAEHCGRYAHVGEFLSRHGYRVAAFDLRGHGRSEGKRLFVRSFEEYLDDLAHFAAHVRQKHPRSPLFLLAHSMGGTIATLFILTRSSSFEGLLLSGPLLRLGRDYSPLQVMAAKLLGRFLPHLPVQKINPAHLSHASEIVHGYTTDPLVYHGHVPASTGAAGLHAFEEIDKGARRLNVPLLLLHGTADLIADVEGSQWLYQQATGQDKTLHLYEGFYHEVLNEVGKERVMQDILVWLEARSQSSKSRQSFDGCREVDRTDKNNQ